MKLLVAAVLTILTAVFLAFALSGGSGNGDRSVPGKNGEIHTEPVPVEPSIDIIPVGEIETDCLASITAFIRERFRIKTEVAAPMELPQPAWDEALGQYNGDWMLRLARVLVNANAYRTLLVTNEQVYSGDLPFVRFLVHQGSDMVLVSFHGLKGPEGIELPLETIRDRAKKLAVRALAASFGVRECDGECLLSGPVKAENLDIVPDYFCAECARLLEDKVGTGIGSPYGHFRAATFYLEDGSINGAIEELKKAVELKEDFVPAYLNLSELYLRIGWSAEAISALRRAVEAAPDSMLPRTRLAQIMLINNQAPAAVEVLEEALEIDPESIEVHRLMGIASHFYTGDFDVARKHYRAFFELGGKSGEIEKLLEELENHSGEEGR